MQITNALHTMLPSFFKKKAQKKDSKPALRPRPERMRWRPTITKENWTPTRRLRKIRKRSLRELHDIDKEYGKSKVENVPDMEPKCHVVDFREFLRQRLVPDSKRRRHAAEREFMEQLQRRAEKKNEQKRFGASGVEFKNAPVPVPKYMKELLSSLDLPPNCKQKIDFSKGLKLVAENEDEKIQLDAAYNFLREVMGEQG